MAANKFATMLHRSSHRVVVVLVYTLLEWILIALLLLNALFSYLIARFAAYFGLPPPCIFCSRLDHLLDGRGGGGGSTIASSQRRLICDAHAAEVSRLGFCTSHRRLAEAGGMCDGCSSSLPSPTGHGRQQTVALLSVVEKEGEEASRCSCCGVELDGAGFFSPYLFFKRPWGVLGYPHHGKSANDGSAEAESEGGGHTDEILEGKAGFVGDAKVFPLVYAADEEEQPATEDGRDGDGDDDEVIVDVVGGDDEQMAKEGEECAAAPSQDPAALSGECGNEEEGDESIEILNRERGLVWKDEHERFVPVDLIDSATLRSLDELPANGEDDEKLGQNQRMVEMEEGDVADIGIVSLVEAVEEAQDEEEVPPPAPEESGCARESSSLVALAEEREGLEWGSCDPQQIQTVAHDDDICEAEVAVVDCEANQDVAASEEDNKMVDGEPNCEVSIGSEICDQEQIDQGGLHDELPPLIDLHDRTLESPVDEGGLHDELPPLIDLHDRTLESPVEVSDESLATIVEVEQTMDGGLGRGLSNSPEHNEVEEERPPETPSYVEGLHNLHKRFLFERRETGTESLDGSVASEVDVGDILTVDHLKGALKAERKALGALYAELEEERSASAIAANQTMAMITRLQEEKAAMQMEALQYQRMMEEQSAYDQEALELLNDLMMKREKEKLDLEKELEVYRKKVLLYEAKERRRLKGTKAPARSETSCASSSADDSDDLSFELNDSDENFDGPKESNQNTPTDTVLSSGQEAAKHFIKLDESLADFEEERFFIIEQLKALEEKLFTLDDGEQSPENLGVVGHYPEENGHEHDVEHESHNSDTNGYENGFTEDLSTNGKHHYESNNVGFRGKRLLPLFDAVILENEDILHEETETMGFSPGSLPNLRHEQKKLAIAEEVDNVYERVQALEADTEFLKHCINSMKKGNKGMDLLQEILQHLRDLRSVELRVRNAGDAHASLST